MYQPCLCGQSSFREVFKGEEKGKIFKVIKCANCGLMRTWPAPISESEALNFYDNQTDYQYRWQELKLWQLFAKKNLHYLKKFINSGKLLDVGCNLGIFVAEAIKEGFDAYGCDPSHQAIEKGREFLKLDGRLFSGVTGDLAISQGSYDIVACLHSLEHFISLDKEIREIKRILKPSGVLLIETPNFKSIWRLFLGSRWYGLAPSQHIWQFDKNSLVKFLEKNGFSIIAHSTSKSMYHKITINFPGLIKLFIHLLARLLRLGDNLIIIAQKK